MFKEIAPYHFPNGIKVVISKDIKLTNNEVIPEGTPARIIGFSFGYQLKTLTTPASYLGSITIDCFHVDRPSLDQAAVTAMKALMTKGQTMSPEKYERRLAIIGLQMSLTDMNRNLLFKTLDDLQEKMGNIKSHLNRDYPNKYGI